MSKPNRVAVAVFLALIVGGVSVTCGVGEPAGSASPSGEGFGWSVPSAPFVLRQQGDTVWVQVHTDTSRCPGDPSGGHGGEATGGPRGSETWCFENGPGDPCGTNPPWDTNCFSHVDVYTLASPTGINYWHIDTYRTDERAYCGSYCLWCGSDGVWDGQPVECGTWEAAPGYGNQWHCIVELDLDSSFTVATGCTLYFDPRYDTECKYDYFYVEFWDGTVWQTLAAFTGTSDNPGEECNFILPEYPNIDYYDNTDIGQPFTCGWQERTDPAVPAFVAVIQEWGDSTYLDSIDCAPSFRWRFYSDAYWSDADGAGDTDGGAFVDNVWVYGDSGCAYTESFEDGSWDSLSARGWRLSNYEGLFESWSMVHDPDPPREDTGYGWGRNTCIIDSSWAWYVPYYYYRSVCEQGGYLMRLMSPTAAIGNSGCVVQYDEYYRVWGCYGSFFIYSDTKVRFHDAGYGTWCPWLSVDGELDWCGADLARFDQEEDLSALYGPGADSVQFAWEVSLPTFPPGEYRCCWCGISCPPYLYYQLDNISIGFYDAAATQFSVRPIDLLHDSFCDSICAHNSFFDEYDADSLAAYSGPPYTPELPWYKQFVVDVYDKTGLSEVQLFGSIDGGTSWTSEAMAMAYARNPDNPSFGGAYYGTLCPDDFGLTRWARGTEAWYYVRVVDEDSNVEYFPSAANPVSPKHAGTGDDCFTFSILPIYPAAYTGVKVLLVAGYQDDVYEWSPCLSSTETIKPIGRIYEQTLVDAGYCYDRFDINGIGVVPHIHPLEYGGYDAVVWFTGPEEYRHLIDKEAQLAIRAYLGAGGKVVLCGGGLARNMAPTDWGGFGQDSLGGEFLSGIMGSKIEDYYMESPFEKPYVYLDGSDTVYVFGTPVGVGLDSLVHYRECPGQPVAMSYTLTKDAPPAGYTAQALLEMLNPGEVDEAHGATYTEYEGAGQCVFLNFDLSGMIVQETGYCCGVTPGLMPDFEPGVYEGRVELMRFILEDLFGLPSGGGGGPSGVVPETVYRWGLRQNVPNPCRVSTQIEYELARACEVTISVYNSRGRLVRTLVSGRMKPGRYSTSWDAANADGRRVASGVYFCTMRAGSFRRTRKMLVLR